METAIMNPLTGRCTVCHDYARDCDCVICETCNQAFTDGSESCYHCEDECE